MDLFGKGADRRKKELDGQQGSSTSSTKFSKSCEVCGLTIFSAALPSDETPIDIDKLSNVCQCFFQPSVVMPTVGCPNNPQQASLQHQQTTQLYKRANYPVGLPEIPPGILTSIPAIVYSNLGGNLQVQSFPTAFLHVRLTDTVPMYHTEVGNRSPYIETREQKPPEESIKSSTKVSDWLKKQSFLSHTSVQEKSPLPPSSASQTSSDEKKFSEFPSQQDEEKRVRKSPCIHGSSTASGYLKNQNVDEGADQGLPELGKTPGIKYNRASTPIPNRILDNSNEIFENKIDGQTHSASRAPRISPPPLIGPEESKHNLHRRGSPKSQNPLKLSNKQSHTDLKKDDESRNVEKQGSSRRKNLKPKTNLAKSKENKDDSNFHEVYDF